MNKELSTSQKNAICALSKKNSFDEGINQLIFFRTSLLNDWIHLVTSCNKEELSLMPFINKQGFENKTIMYSLYHVIRIEDIVINEIMGNTEEVFFQKDYQNKMNSPIITTGNELVKEEIKEFSKKIIIDELIKYAMDVVSYTNEYFASLQYIDLKNIVSKDSIDKIRNIHVVSEDSNAVWLLDYWNSKSFLGLIKMPLSRHWIMHYEASCRIIQKIRNN